MQSLKDGIYDVTGIDFIQTQHDPDKYIDIDNNGRETIKDSAPDNVKDFVSKYGIENCVIASAYETGAYFILAKTPTEVFTGERFKTHWLGSGFNYGSTNILRDCPKDILILAEND